ncbi:MAG: hypothetical protein QM770_17805 [Tepidisphaeraceae bacterium]
MTQPPHPPGPVSNQVRLRNAHQIVGTLSQVTAEYVEPHEKVAELVRRLSTVIGDEFDYTLLLFDTLERRPIPRLIQRVVSGPSVAVTAARSIAEVQSMLDTCGPLRDQILPTALRQLRTPNAYIYSQDADPNFFRDVYKPAVLDPNGWIDSLACYWAGSKDHLIVYNAMRRVMDRPFVDTDRGTMSLLTRAVAPVIDAAMFQDPPMPQLANLDASLQPVLLAMLHGYSDREIAQLAGTMTDYIDILIKRIFKQFDVSSRGELMALFVDQSVVRWLEAEHGQAISPDENTGYQI